MKRLFFQANGKLAVLMGLLATAGWLTVAVVARESASPPKVIVSDKPIDRTGRFGSFAPVVKKVAPSVVNISSKRTVPRATRHESIHGRSIAAAVLRR